MADRDRVDIEFRTTADTTGAQQAKAAIDGVAASAGAATTQSQNAGQAMAGGLASGAGVAAKAVAGLARTVTGLATGFVVGAAIAAVTTAIDFLVSAIGKAEQKLPVLKDVLSQLSPKAREAAGEMLALAQANEKNSNADKAKSQIDELAASLKNAADQAERLKNARDAVTKQNAAEATANVNLAEAKGQMTPEQAEAARNQIQYDRDTRLQSSSTDAAQQQRQAALQALREAEARKRAADSELYGAQNDFDARIPQGPMDPEALGQQIAQADQKVQSLEAVPPLSERVDPTGAVTRQRDAAIEQAKRERAELEETAKALMRVEQAEKAAAEAKQNLDKISKEANSTIEKANAAVQEQASSRRVTDTDAQTKAQQAKNEQAEQAKEFREKAEKEAARQKEQLFKESERKTGDSLKEKKKQEAAEQKEQEKRGAERAGAVREAQEIAGEARGIKAPSPEVAGRLENAARSLEDGADEGELERLNGVLDRLAKSLEKRGKNSEAQEIRQLGSRIDKLEGVVSRIESAQTGSGSY